MADPVLSISAASSIGKNFATLNGSITPNATSHAWRDGTASDTDCFWQFLDVNGHPLVSDLSTENTSPFDLAPPTQTEYVNTDDYPLPTTPVLVTGSSPVDVSKTAYMLESGVTYYVRLCARRFQWPGSGFEDIRGDRASQPYQLFATAMVSFTCT